MSYVKFELKANNRFIEFDRQNNHECTKLAFDIVDKASGVFLWVYLVVRSLLEGLRNGDGVGDLQRRLNLIPADLEEYLAHIINNLEPFYLEQATQLFEVALKAHKPLSLLSYSFLHEDDPDFAIEAKVKPWTQTQIDHRLATAKRRLNSRCKGLLDVYKPTNYQGEADHRPDIVDFLHRTVRDFLLTMPMQTLITESQVEKFGMDTALCRAYLAQVKGFGTISASLGVPEDLLVDFLEYARRHESATSEPQIAMIDDLDRAGEEICRIKHPYHSSKCHWTSDYVYMKEFMALPIHYVHGNPTFLPLALGAGLPCYVKQKLQEHIDLPGRPEIHLLLLLALGVDPRGVPVVNRRLRSPLRTRHRVDRVPSGSWSRSTVSLF